MEKRACIGIGLAAFVRGELEVYLGLSYHVLAMRMLLGGQGGEILLCE